MARSATKEPAFEAAYRNHGARPVARAYQRCASDALVASATNGSPTDAVSASASGPTGQAPGAGAKRAPMAGGPSASGASTTSACTATCAPPASFSTEKWA